MTSTRRVPTAETVLELAGRQIASPVQFVKGLQTLYASGARVFVEVGPKKALHGFVEDVLGSEHDDVVALYTNHPKVADDVAFNQALCGLYAAGVGLDRSTAASPENTRTTPCPSTGNGPRTGTRHDGRGAGTRAVPGPTTRRSASSGCSSPTCSRRACTCTPEPASPRPAAGYTADAQRPAATLPGRRPRPPSNRW